MTFFRFCNKCEERFNPETKFRKICSDCREKVRRVNLIKLIHYNKGIGLNTIRGRI